MHGALTLDADGSFILYAGAQLQRTESFTYKANDRHNRLETYITGGDHR
jgi:hypothetical protein